MLTMEDRQNSERYYRVPIGYACELCFLTVSNSSPSHYNFGSSSINQSQKRENGSESTATNNVDVKFSLNT